MVLCGVVSVKLKQLYYIRFIHVHSYNVTDPDRFLEPFSGSEVQ